MDVTLEEPSHGGYAGARLGEAQNPGPTAHERDREEERSARRTRINEAGDAAPGSQDSITQKVQNLQLTDSRHRRPLVQPEHHRQCPTLEDPLRRDHVSNGTTLLSVVLIQPEIQTMASCCPWVRSTGSAADSRKRGPASPARSGGLRILWCHSIEVVQSLQSLHKGHSNLGHHSE